MEKVQRKENLKKYLESVIDMSGYNTDGAILFDTLNNVHITCKSEKARQPRTIETIKDRLMGLPSCLGIAFTYYDISKVLAACGFKETTDSEYQDKHYWYNLASIIKKG